MKILQVTAVDFTVQKFLLPLVEDLKVNGYEVHIACHIETIGEELKAQGFDLRHVPFDRSMNAVNHLKALSSLVRLIREEKYDIVHSHTPVASLIARMAAKITGVPFSVYTAHGFYFHENMKPAAYRVAYTLEKLWGRHLTDVLFFQSREDYDLALTGKFSKPDRLVHINNGVSGERFNPANYDRAEIRQKLGLIDERVVLFIGRLVEEKGVRELISAFNRLAREQPDLVLLIVGDCVKGDRGSIDSARLLDGLDEDVRRRIQLLGLRNDIPELLAAADLFTLPSYREGMPRSIIEAMAMGKPIVATDIRGCREEVFPGVNGLLCKNRDAESLARCLDELLADEQKRRTFGAESRRLFLEMFDEQKVIARQLAVFNTFRGERGLKEGRLHV